MTPSPGSADLSRDVNHGAGATYFITGRSDDVGPMVATVRHCCGRCDDSRLRLCVGDGGSGYAHRRERRTPCWSHLNGDLNFRRLGVAGDVYLRIRTRGLASDRADFVHGLASRGGSGCGARRVHTLELDGDGLDGPKAGCQDNHQRRKNSGGLSGHGASLCRCASGKPARAEGHASVLSARLMMPVSSSATSVPLTIFMRSAANAQAAMVPTAYSAVDMPRSRFVAA